MCTFKGRELLIKWRLFTLLPHFSEKD